jgi:hypothetical protein
MVHPNNTYDEPGGYVITLVAIDDKGCTDTIAKPINILEAYYVYVPNTFTPDGMRFNNTFWVSTVNVKALSITIYNRWGQLIYTSENLNFEWDGTFNGVPVQEGTYTWKLRVTPNQGKEEQLTGHVNVLR